MSYREVRDFTEMMRVLGYPRLISIENFQNPNFCLVAEILVWLVYRFDPVASISTDYDTEEQRVALVRSIAEFMAVKAGIKLNTKRLYQADGHAVKELLKITSLIYKALKNSSTKNTDSVKSSSRVPLTGNFQDLKTVRELSSRIAIDGASLYELLGQELELREARYTKVNMPLDISSIESGLKQSIKNLNNTVTQTKQMIENIATTEASLDVKIEKRQVDLERNKKRLESLKKVRPSFLEEYEKLEKDFKELYEAYVVRYRCVAYLEQQLEEFEQATQSRIDAKHEETRKLVEKMRQEAAAKLFDGTIEDEGQAANGAQTAGTGSRMVGGKRRVFGSMTGGGDDLGSSDSDSDLFFDDDDDNDDDDDEDDDDDDDDEDDDDGRHDEDHDKNGDRGDGDY
nr:PREDICTED: clusterin-associated protein 1 homolog [Bemisia tabaci]